MQTHGPSMGRAMQTDDLAAKVPKALLTLYFANHGSRAAAAAACMRPDG